MNGACAASSTNALPLNPGVASGTINVWSGAAVIKNLSLSGGASGIYVHPGATADLEGLIISGPGARGLTADNSTVSAREVEIRGTPDVGVLVWNGGHLVLERVNVAGTTGYASVSLPQPGSTLSVTDVVIRDGSRNGGATSAAAIYVLAGATVTGTRVLIERTAPGIDATGGSLRLDYAIVRDTHAAQDQPDGVGVTLTDAASATLTHAKIERTPGIGLSLASGAKASLVDALIQDTHHSPNGASGVGIAVNPLSTAVLQRVAVQRFATGATLLAGGTADVEDLTIDGTGADLNGGVYGFEVYGGAGVARRISVDRLPAGFGLVVTMTGTATVTDFRIDSSASGVLAQAAHLLLERVSILGSKGEGVTADSGGSWLDLTDITASGSEGHALVINSALHFRLERAMLEDNGGAGIFMINSPFAAFDVVSRSTRALASNEPGSGLRMTGTTTGAVTRLLFESNAAFGIELLKGAQVDLHQGRIRNNRVGVLVTNADFDLRRLLDAVVFEGNGSSFSQ
jgi:hypothetical protein